MTIVLPRWIEIFFTLNRIVFSIIYYVCNAQCISLPHPIKNINEK